MIEITTLTATQLANAINKQVGSEYPVKDAIANYINYKYRSSIKKDNISASTEDSGGSGKIKVQFTGSGVTGEKTSDAQVISEAGKNVKVEITVTNDNKGNLGDNTETKAKAIADKIASFVAVAALTHKLNTDGSITTPTDLTTTKLQRAIGQAPVKEAIASLVNAMYGAEVNTESSGKDIIASDSGVEKDTLKVELRPASSAGSNRIANGDGQVDLAFSDSDNKGVTVTIKISGAGSLKTGDSENNNEAAKTIADKIAN